MSGSKKNKFNEDEEIDFNNPDSFEKIASQMLGENKNGFSFKSIPKNIIGFLTGNIKISAIFLIYILLCGIGLNIYLISKINYIYIIIAIIIISIISYCYKNRKKWTGLKNFFNRFGNNKNKK